LIFLSSENKNASSLQVVFNLYNWRLFFFADCPVLKSVYPKPSKTLDSPTYSLLCDDGQKIRHARLLKGEHGLVCPNVGSACSFHALVVRCAESPGAKL